MSKPHWSWEQILERGRQRGMVAQEPPAAVPVAGSVSPRGDTVPKAGKRRSEMNKTEARFARLLEAKVQRGEIVSFEYEGLTLRWPDGMRYTGDFFVVNEIGDIDGHPLVAATIIEVKGAHSWAKDVVKFRAARDKWGNRYCFQFWQEVDGEWKETR